MASERLTNSLGLLDAAAGVVLANYTRIDIGRGDMENAAREALGVVLSVVLAAVIAGRLGGHSELQGINNSSIITK